MTEPGAPRSRDGSHPEAAGRSPQRWWAALALKSVVVPLAVTASLAMSLYYQALLVAPLHRHSFETFYQFDRVDGSRLREAWTPRVLSLAGAEWLRAHGSSLPQFRTALKPPRPAAVAIGQWLACWFALVGVILVAAFRHQAVFYLLGTYAGVTFGYGASTAQLRIYPWDMPALAVFTLFVALLHGRRSPKWIVLGIWAGMLFKETAVVLSLFPLALPMPWRKRGLLGGLTLLGCVLIKVGIDWATDNSALGFTMAWRSFYGEGSLLAFNLRALLTGYPLAINGGTLLAFLLWPTARRDLLALKAIALAFVAGNFLFGVVNEYRIWFEAIPLALYGLWSPPTPELDAPRRGPAGQEP